MKTTHFLALLALAHLATPIIWCESLQNCCKKYGSRNASVNYTKQTHEYIKLLGQKNSEQVPIKQFDSQSKHLIGLGTPARCVANIGIWLDETILNQLSTGKQNFILAHEAAHWVQSFFTRFATSKYLEKNADLKAAKMLCQNGYGWVVRDYVSALKYEIANNINTDDDGQHPLKKDQVIYLEEILNKNIKH